MPLSDQWKKIGDLQLDGLITSRIRSLCTERVVPPLCTVALNCECTCFHLPFVVFHWNIVAYFYTFLIFRSLAVVKILGISTRGWLVFNSVFRFGGHKCTQIWWAQVYTNFIRFQKSCFLYYIHTKYDTMVEWRTKCARTNSHTPGRPLFV